MCSHSLYPHKGVVKLRVHGLQVLDGEFLAHHLLVEGHAEAIVDELAVVQSLEREGCGEVREDMHTQVQAHTTSVRGPPPVQSTEANKLNHQFFARHTKYRSDDSTCIQTQAMTLHAYKHTLP